MIALFPSRQVALEIFGFGIHWYGLLYLLSFIIAIVLLPHLQKYRNVELSSDEWLTIVSYAVIGVIVGGRLGFVLFYEPSYFVANPVKVFAVWEGGMASHGGFIGVVLALGICLWKKKYDIWRIADIVVVPVAIGLALGRIGNFINQELYGTVTTLPWGISIPGVEGLRHPTQIYAFIKDLFIAGICFWHLKAKVEHQPGRTFALFLMLYGVLRFLVEFLRDQPYPPLALGPMLITRGQILTMPIFLVGVFLWFWLGARRKSSLTSGI